MTKKIFKKYLPYSILFMLITINFLVFFVINVDIVEASNPTPYISSWGEQIIFTADGGAENCGMFTGILRTRNGTLVAFQKTNGNYPSCEEWTNCYYKRSWDNGVTWESSKTLLWTTSQDAEVHCAFSCPNGWAIQMMAPTPHSSGGNAMLYRSTDNGSTWGYWRTMTELGSIRFFGFTVYNKVIYGFYQDCCTNTVAKICRSFDNATTFSYWATVKSSDSDEWWALPLNNTGSWRTIHRDGQCWSYNFLTNNNWSSSVSTNEDNPSTFGHNRGPNLWWLDDEVIVAQVEQGDDSYCGAGSGPHFYCSWDYMVSWHNETKMGDECTTSGGNAYGFGVTLPKNTFGRSGLGGIGYMVYTKNSNTQVCGRWIANNRSQDWTWPAGPDDSGYEFYGDEPSTTDASEFITINDDTNNSVVYTGYRWYNGTIPSITNGTIYYYNIQIANDSLFTDVFANISYINETFGGITFDEFTNYWTYNDTINPITGYGGSYGGHYYRFRVRIKCITD